MPIGTHRPQSYWTYGRKRLARFRDFRTEDEIDDLIEAEHQIFMKIKRELDDPNVTGIRGFDL